MGEPKPVRAWAASEILDALIASSSGCIWAKELAFFSGKSRIDFFTIQPTASQMFRTNAYEIKVSRADFARDSAEKQDGALKWSDRFWYVTPPGLIGRHEVPEWAGLQEWDGALFAVKRKAPPRHKQPPDWEFIVSMLRNSGDCRRDVELMKMQIGFMTARIAEYERRQKIQNDLTLRRWIEKSQRQRTHQ